MTAAFYVAGALALLATGMVVTRANAVHALLWLLVSFVGVAVVLLTLGAPFLAALEIVIYAGAVIVLFLFAVMLLAIDRKEVEAERADLAPRRWIAPAALVTALLGALGYAILAGGDAGPPARRVGPEEVGRALFGHHVVAVELAGLLLLAGLVGAYHLARPDRPSETAATERGEPGGAP